MNAIAPIIIAQAKMGVGYAERLLKDIRPDHAGRFATMGGITMRSNHPTFVFGHLSLYPSRALTLAGQPVPDAAKCSLKFEELFKAGVECRDDADGSIYPGIEEVTRCFFDGTKAAIAAISSIQDEVFLTENPVEGKSRERFPTIGAAITFYLGGHAQMHLGQISAWRRAMGMAPAM